MAEECRSDRENRPSLIVLWEETSRSIPSQISQLSCSVGDESGSV